VYLRVADPSGRRFVRCGERGSAAYGASALHAGRNGLRDGWWIGLRDGWWIGLRNGLRNGWKIGRGGELRREEEGERSRRGCRRERQERQAT